MKILSEAFKIYLDKNPNDPNTYNIQVYPNVISLPKANDKQYRLTLDLNSLRTDVNLKSLLESALVKTFKSEDELIAEYLNGYSNPYCFDYFDSIVELLLEPDDCIARMSFSYTDIMDVGFLEEQLIYFDVNFNTKLMGSTLILAEVLALVRKVLKWPEFLDELV